MDHRAVTEEILRQSRQNEKLDKERAELFAIMLRHPAWALYTQLLDTMLSGLGTVLLEPMRGRESEAIKGTMRGLILARDLPSITVSQLKEQRANEEEEDEDAT